ncbi:MAG TPA: alpha/beta hydrolase [Gemmataceae bacterium]|jgi:acetyl esterase/lipase
MRKLMLPALAGLLLLSAGRAHADEARAIIEKAVKAYGGEEKLAKLKMVRAKARGTVNLGSDVPFTLEMVWQGPDHLKNTVKLESAKPTTLVETIAGGDSWSSRDGKPGPLSAIKLDELRTQAHVHRLLRLTPLLRENIYELAELAERRIEDRPAVGVRVRSPGEREVKLYFEKETGKLVKIERLLHDASAKKEVRHEEFFRDYEDIDGVPTAMTQTWHHDGKKALEMTFSEVHYPDRIDPAAFADPRPYTRRRDVVYGHKSGVALTMDVFTPKKDANGKAIIAIISGGWFSSQATIDDAFFMNFVGEPIRRGYTVFAVCHGSQPLFTIPDAVADINRAVRYIRYHARDFRIDPRRIGVTGGSAGGHLSLMQGTAGDLGNRKAADPVERTSSRVQAIACFFPPTDFLNYGKEGAVAFAEDGVLAGFRSAIDVRALDKKSHRLEHLTDKEKLEALYRRVSPIAHVSADDPPTLIIHGDADKLVPIQQAEVMIARLKKVGVPAELVVKKGAVHGWANMEKDVVTFADWFDKYLRDTAAKK